MYNLLAVEPQKGGINMATRQYIGARYVPIIDGEWDITKEYDPLVVVMYQGNSYTSRTFVPANTPITNTTYWALTGNYNAQVEAYRQEVSEYVDDIDAFGVRVNNVEDNIEAFENSMLKRTDIVQTTQVTVYLSATVGSDNNDGLSQNSPVATIDKALDIGQNEGAFDFRIQILDNSTYNLSAWTISGITLHLFGNNATIQLAGRNVAWYNCHLNFSDINFTQSNTDGNEMYCDNTFVQFNNVKFLHMGFACYECGVSLTSCQFVRLRMTRTMFRLTGCVYYPESLNALGDNLSLTCAECYGIITTSMTVHNDNNTIQVISVTATTINWNCILTVDRRGSLKNDGSEPYLVVANNGHFYGTHARLYSLEPLSIGNGAQASDEYGKYTPLNYSTVIHDYVAGGYIHRDGYENYYSVRFSLILPEFTYLNSGISLVPSLFHVYYNGTDYDLSSSYTEVVVRSSKVDYCKLIEVKFDPAVFPDLTSLDATPVSLRLSGTMSYNSPT